MKKLTLVIFIFFSFFKAHGVEDFNFDVTEIEILDKGNIFIGKNGGTAKSDSGIVINAQRFEYNKNLNILKAIGNVTAKDVINNYIIISNEIIYKKNEEIINSKKNSKGIIIDDNIEISANEFIYDKNKNYFFAKKNVRLYDKNKNTKIFSDKAEYFVEQKNVFTNGNSKVIDVESNLKINANNFNYDIKNNKIIAEENVSVENNLEDYKIFSHYLIYFKNKEKIFSKGETQALIHSKYNFNSEDVTFDRKKMELSSNKNTLVTDKLNSYNLKKFKYFINERKINGEKITVTSNFKSPNFDKFYFSSAIINLETQKFIAKDTEIRVHKNVFNDRDNDPRIKGVSSKKIDEILTIEKGIFTSCKKDDNCPPWTIQANQIKHNEKKKQIIYNNALLKIYDVPVFYFPKFFHPDPTVERQSGFLKPQINNSDELGDSLHIPYFYVIAPDKDFTFKPTFFNNGLRMLQNEYRQKNKNSYFRTDFSLTTNYKSKLSENKNSISHLFSKFESDLDLENFDTSDLYVSVQKVTNDTYLKVFDSNLIQTELKPQDQNNLSSEVKLDLANESYTLSSGLKLFEDLGKSNNDRYQFILPYYDFNKKINLNFFPGEFYFSSTGNNNLKNTNQLKSKIINNFDLQFEEKIIGNGLVNQFNISFKNTNLLGKNDANYKSSPQIELMNIYELKSKLPLQKKTERFKDTLTPEISLRFNPSDMKNYSTSQKNINVDNIFNINRLGLDDSFEKGRSLTLGLDYKKESLRDINKYFKLKLATNFKDKEENFIPASSSLNKKNSALFGSTEFKFSDNLLIDYKFRVDNNYERFEYNSINTNLKFKNLTTNINFVEENGEAGDENFIENNTTYSVNKNNSLTFSTRRNRKINLTEFYNLAYEYKNDCLVASIKYNKKYYSDRELKPSENLLFTLTLVPLTTYEHNETNLFKD